MSLVVRIQLVVSSMLQLLKSRNTLKHLKQQIQTDLIYLHQLESVKTQPAGTLIVKCDDIGDFLVWQQVIPILKEQAPRPLILVANVAIKSIYEQYFEFADEVIWVNKKQWHESSYRQALYQRVRAHHVAMAMTPLFTRNYALDDLIVLASGAPSTYAWHRLHHAYFPGMNLLDHYFTNQICTVHPVKLEYFRNIEFMSKVFKVQVPETFQVLFPNFKKYNTLVVVPVASTGSKTWKAVNFASTISALINDFDKCILLGGSNGLAAADEICRLVDSPKLINLVDQTQLYEAFAFIGEASVLLTLDTFASHIGALTATNTVMVSNGTNSQRFADYAPYIDSKFVAIYPSHYKVNPNRLKIRYSSSEIQTIQVSTVVNAIKQLRS